MMNTQLNDPSIPISKFYADKDSGLEISYEIIEKPSHTTVKIHYLGKCIAHILGSNKLGWSWNYDFYGRNGYQNFEHARKHCLQKIAQLQNKPIPFIPNYFWKNHPRRSVLYANKIEAAVVYREVGTPNANKRWHWKAFQDGEFPFWGCKLNGNFVSKEVFPDIDKAKSNCLKCVQWILKAYDAVPREHYD